MRTLSLTSGYPVAILSLASFVLVSSALFATESLPEKRQSADDQSQDSHVYKYTDSEGNVTYSSTQIEGHGAADSIEIAPPPSSEQIDESLRRTKEIELAADAMTTARDRRNRAQEQQARQALELEALRNSSAASDEVTQPEDYRDQYYPVWGGYPHIPVPHPRPPIDHKPIHAPSPGSKLGPIR